MRASGRRFNNLAKQAETYCTPIELTEVLSDCNMFTLASGRSDLKQSDN